MAGVTCRNQNRSPKFQLPARRTTVHSKGLGFVSSVATGGAGRHRSRPVERTRASRIAVNPIGRVRGSRLIPGHSRRTYASQDNADGHNLVGGPVAENSVSSVGHQHHLFEPNSTVAGFTFATFDGNNHAWQERLRMIKRPEAADHRLFVAHSNAVSHFSDQHRLVFLISPC